jgi:hypothetical protein
VWRRIGQQGCESDLPLIACGYKRAICIAHLLVKLRVTGRGSKIALGNRRASEPIDEG